MTALTWIDYIVVVVLALFLVRGLFKGFVKEVTGIIVWLVSFGLSVYLSKLGADMLNPHIANPTTRLVVAFVLIFLIGFIVLSVIRFLLCKMVDMTGLSVVNRILGGAFGLFKGAIVLCIAVWLLNLTSVSANTVWQNTLSVQWANHVNKLLWQEDFGKWVESAQKAGEKTAGHVSKQLQSVQAQEQNNARL